MVKAGASRFYSSGGQGARAVTVVQLSASRSVSHIHDPVQCGMPVCSVENGGAGAAHFGIAVGGSGLRLLISEQLVLGAASRRSMPPAGPPAASHGQPTVLHQLRPPRTRLRRSRCAQPPRRRNSAVRGGSCRSAGQWRAPRPVSPGTVTLMADARCARRSADALNELRPLRQRVSRAAGICLPAAAAGCERSLARRCRQSAA